MGLGPRGRGRAGPPRRAGPMITAILFGSLISGGWRLGPPSASAGRPRLRRPPGDACGDARTRRAADGRGLGRRLFYRSPLAGLCRSAPSPAVLAMAQSKGKGNVLTERDVTEEEKLAIGKTGSRVLETKFVHLPSNVQKACGDGAFKLAVQTELGLKMPPSKSLLETAIKRYRAQPTPEPAKTIRAPPRRRAPGPQFPVEPPPKWRPPRKAPAQLAIQDQKAGESAIVAVGPPTSMAAAAQYALRAHAGETEVVAHAPQIVKVKKAGGNWEEYTSQTKAARKVPGLTRSILRDIFGGKASDKFEACLVSKERPINKQKAYQRAADVLGLRFNISKATDPDAYALELVPRVVLPPSVKERPKSWKALLEYVKSLSSRDQRVLSEQTRRAENERVLKLCEASGIVGREVQRQLRREEAEASALATEAAHVDLEQLGYFDEDGVRDDEDFLVDKENVQVSFIPDYVSRPDGPAKVRYKDKCTELKAADWKLRVGFGPGNVLIEHDGVVEATLRRPTSAHASVLSMELASGKTGRKHGGIGGSYFATLTARQEPWEYLRQRFHDPWLQLSRVGFHEAPIYRTAATTCDGQVVDGAGTTVLGLFLTADGPDLIGEFDNELFRLSEMLRATTRAAPQLSHRVRAGYRRDMHGTGRNPSIELCRPPRYSGPTKLALRKLQFAKTHDFPIIHEVMRRCIAHCVTFELVAYSEIAPDRPRFHVDSAVALLLSALQMKSVTMKEGANLQRSKQHFTRADLAQMEECSDGDSVI